MATIDEKTIREKAYLIMDWCSRKGDNLNDTDFISHVLMDIAHQQKALDMEKARGWLAGFLIYVGCADKVDELTRIFEKMMEE